VTSQHDDVTGLVGSSAYSRPPTPLQAFVALPGAIAVVDSVVAGATAGIAALGLDAGTGLSLAIAVATFVLALAAFVAIGVRKIGRYRRDLEVRFPSPG